MNNDSTFVSKRKKMSYLHSVFNYFNDSQDPIIISVKWTFAWVVVSIPSFMPDVQFWLKTISIVLGVVTGVGGAISTWSKVLDTHPKIKKFFSKLNPFSKK